MKKIWKRIGLITLCLTLVVVSMVGVRAIMKMDKPDIPQRIAKVSKPVKQLTGAELLNSSGQYGAACDFNSTYDAEQKAWKNELVMCQNLDNCYFAKNVQDMEIPVSDYKYVVVLAKCNCDFKISYTASVEMQLRTTRFDSYSDWMPYIIEIDPADSGYFRSFRFDLLDLTPGNSLYINSIAFFETVEQARAYAGTFEN